MLIEPIEDIPATVDVSESYIQDLETEIDNLRAEVKKLSKKPTVHKDYDNLLMNFHKLLDEIIPF